MPRKTKEQIEKYTRKKELLEQIPNKQLMFILSVSKGKNRKITKIIEEILRERPKEDLDNLYATPEKAAKISYQVVAGRVTSPMNEGEIDILEEV